MASVKGFVSLRLQSGEKFDHIAIQNPEKSLAEFLDQALKQLESESRLSLPDTEDELIDPKDFKVFDEQHKHQLELNVAISKQPYFTECQQSGKTPVLLLESQLFRNAAEVDKDIHVKTVLRRQTYSEGSLQKPRRHHQREVEDPNKPPRAPHRSSSLRAKSTNKEAMIYLAGRREYDPQSNQLQRERTSLSESAMFYYNEDIVDRMFGSSGSLSTSEETSSLYSWASMGTEQGLVPSADGGSVSKGYRPRSADVHRKHLKRRGSNASAPATSNQLEPTHLRYHSADATYSRTSDSVSETMTQGSWSGSDTVSQRSKSPVSKSPKEKIPVVKANSFSGSDATTLGFPTIQERSESITDEAWETPIPPLSPTIEVEGASESTQPRAETPSGRGEREKSPGLLERPISPEPQGVSPGVSPVVSPAGSPRMGSKFNRKTKLATRRRTTKALKVPETDGGGDGQPLKDQPSFTRHRTIYDRKSRISTSFLPYGVRVFGKIKTFVVEFDIPTADLVIEMDVGGDYTVGQIKENLWNELRDQGYIHDEFLHLWDPDRFTFTYQMKGETYELYDEQQIFQTASVVQLWRSEKMEKGLLSVEMKKTESKEEKTLNMEISAMIGIGLYQLQFANNDELDITRRKMVAVRRNAVRSRDAIQYAMEIELNFQALPPHVMDQIHDEKILVRVYYKQGLYQTFQVDIHSSADDFLPQVFPDKESKRVRLGIPVDCDINDYVLKVSGQNSYIHGNYDMIQFAYVVQCLGKKQDIELSLVQLLDPNEDCPRDIPDCNLIDDFTGHTGTHTELSALTKEHTQVFTMSMWDIQLKFRLRIVGLDNLRNADTEVIYIDAGIYHGGELIVDSRYSSEIATSAYPRWNQWLIFDIAVKNLPKAARLCIQVVGGNRAKDTKKKSGTRGRRSKDDKRGDQADRPLHWVNMQILDHRALLRQGLLRLNLWPVLPDNNGGTTTSLSPMGSTAINPDGNNSAVLYLELDTYTHPIACPTGGWGEEVHSIPEQSLKEGSVFEKDLKRTISADPLTTLDKAQKELIWKFRSYCSKIPEALPKFLRCVNWADLDQVCEAHRLLKSWKPITLEVALELLDYHFADEKVRSLAVRELEKLPNDELLCYLLQLIQVLKFEPYHDSALARYLLKRALRSKRIGHFFYWYLRSEMDTPEFNQRFGILLEAYLRGCGEAMFREIRNQHKAVCDVMAVAASLKKYLDRHGNKGVADYAREELAKYQLPESFAPPYDSCLTMGNLNIPKCRVMDSKKSPLWLEFQDMDDTAVLKKPIKVIAKHGDDLRQDMLTLQMLSLMDKLWQSEGLDLHIIPYGCIATGHNMGMIQVVQEAETVAKIQQKQGGTFSALKEEPLHDWLKNQNPVQARFETAVERFMLSCAGYCVATYVLGIGDRHNDNIMVTTSGNLFHIDFGHFLGHKKEFMGVNRERAPFVLTPDFEYVMGKRNSDLFKTFEETAVKAFMIIRQHANLFINLFSMMKCTGIPELRSVEDLDYLRDVLVLGRTPPEAEEHFKSQIQKCLKLSWSTQLNWLTHSIVHSRS